MTKHPNRFDFTTACRFMVIVAILDLTGCMAVGPDYVPPKTSSPAEWHSDLKNGLNEGIADIETLAKWWRVLNDPVLSGLIQQAIVGNLDIKDACARLREARARRGSSRAGLFPVLNAEGAAVKSGTRQPDGQSRTTELFSAGFDAGWEVDLFGGTRRAVEAADANIDAANEYLRDVLASLLAETALNYVEARTYQVRLDAVRANLQAQEEMVDITRFKFEAGLSNELPVQQASYSLAGARAQIPVLETGLEESKNRLAVLTGQPPGAVHQKLTEHRPIPASPATIAVGIPADALRQRADVRRAERLLAAQTARIGAAEAERYPKIRFGGSIGLEALSAGDLFNNAARFWRFGPSITWPIFDAGAIRANIAVQTALQEQTLRQYEKTVLTALEEVENSLVAYANESIRRQYLMDAVTAAQKAASLAGNQYKAGLVDFSHVLETERSVLSYQDQLAQSNGAVAAHLIRLYKSLGGGWSSLAADAQIDKE